MAKKRVNSTAHRSELPRPQAPADDAVAFREAVRDVKPLSHTPAVAAHSPPARRRRRAPLPAEIVDVGADMPLVHATADDVATAGDAISFHRAGVRSQVLRHLRRGLYPVEDELDLHGMTQTAARDYLAEFLAFNRQAGRRCVRIIHGKGYRSGARGPILKIAVNTWLRRHLDVLAFTSARAIDGGTGAVYVLLRG
jgi:DNA-nicking Smr family endonuclease